MIRHAYVNSVLLILMIIAGGLFVWNGSQINQTQCTYGRLSNGCVAWGLDLNHEQVPGSTMISLNGTDAIRTFDLILKNYTQSTYICFEPFPVVNPNQPNSPVNWSYYVAISIYTLGLAILSVVTVLSIIEHRKLSNMSES